MTIDELRQIMHQLKLDFDSDPQLIYVFYQTPEGLINNISISVQHARQSNRRPLTDGQLADMVHGEYPSTRDGRLLAVERPDGLTQWLDTAEVCQRLNTTRQTVNRWARQGLLHAARMGRRNFFDAAEIDALMRSNIIQENGRIDKKGSKQANKEL